MINVEKNIKTGEEIYKTKLNNGLQIFICPKKGYTKKIGMYGTVFGSIDNDFIDITTGKRIKVTDGIAHFLEHKLFEQDGANALDVFAKMGVSSNAYTSFDHTVYFFETNDKFEECVEKLLDFVNTPYFTDENVEKEKGIIGQEIRMYDDEPNAVVYYNTLRAMYQKYPLRIDIAGTIESVNSINKETLYSCYNTFYNPANMFIIIIGDVAVEDTIKKIKQEFDKKNERLAKDVTKFEVYEPKDIAEKTIEKAMDVYMPMICIGFKHGKKDGVTNIKNQIITEIINEVCFSDLSDFYEELYNLKIINEPVEITYEAGKEFAHTIIMAASKEYKKCEQKIKEYIHKLRSTGIDEKLFKVALKKKQGEMIFDTEDLMSIHRDIIDSIIQNTEVFEPTKAVYGITKKDIDDFIKEYLTEENMVISRVIEK